MTKREELIKILNEHGSLEMGYVALVALLAAKEHLDSEPTKFLKSFGTLGVKAINEYNK